MAEGILEDSTRKKVKKLELTQRIIILLLGFGFVLILAAAFLLQGYAERNALPLVNTNLKDSISKEQYERFKLAAEIKQIRSDTTGSLFWLKIVALFVTVGGAVGGYLIGLSNNTKKRLNFERRKEIDLAYQAIIQELSGEEAILRAAAAVKLGALLQDFPTEWEVGETRRNELVQLTKEVLAAALSIEKNKKVLKTISIALVRRSKQPSVTTGDHFPFLQNIDLSGANAKDAYWAKVDFTYADFFRANLEDTSFRNSKLNGAQFYKSKLNRAVFTGAECVGTNFKMADLREAEFSKARLDPSTNFEGAKVHGIKIGKESFEMVNNVLVDVSEDGDGSRMEPFQTWLQASLSSRNNLTAQG